MKRRIFKKAVIPVPVCLALLLTAALAWGQVPPPVKISITASNPTYQYGEPIKMQVDIKNVSGYEAISRWGFKGLDDHLLITFTRSDGTIIRSTYKVNYGEPGPPPRFGGKDAVFVELIPADWLDVTLLNDAREFYDLFEPGTYTAQVKLPMETFSSYVVDEVTEDLYAFADDPGRESYNPVSSNKVVFTIEPPVPVGSSALDVYVKQLNIGPGVAPEVRNEPLMDVLVKLYPIPDIPADCTPANWQNYDCIWNKGTPVRSVVTNYNGQASMGNVPQDDYLVLGLYDKSPEFRYFGGNVAADDPDWEAEVPVTKRLMVMVRADGRQIPGKTTRLRGSDLLITEPEFVTWDSTVELYPFVFETIGEWGITTTVEPPEGFVADYEALSTEVNDETESVQFTITDVGSKWIETDVTFDIQHKDKKIKIKSKVGIKCSKKLQKEKNFDKFCKEK